MFTCRICRFLTELDDVIVTPRDGYCFCLRCYLRETLTARPMSPALRRAIEAAMAA